MCQYCTLKYIDVYHPVGTWLFFPIPAFLRRRRKKAKEGFAINRFFYRSSFQIVHSSSVARQMCKSVSQYSIDGSAHACALIDNFHVQTYTCVFAKLFFDIFLNKISARDACIACCVQ